MQNYKQEFFDLSMGKGILRFGEFTLKSGRISPYFFNAGGFDDGHSLDKLARCYASAIQASGIEFDLLFGPAYKGIPLAATTAMALASEHQRNVAFAYNRKEAKDHGEGGITVGAPLKGRILIIDDVISAGTSVRESIDMITAAGATPCGVAIALDRQEKGQDAEGREKTLSAAQEVTDTFDIPVISIAGLSDLIAHLEQNKKDSVDIEAIRQYRQRYGV